MARKPAPQSNPMPEDSPPKPRSRCILIPGDPPSLACGLDATPEQIARYAAGAFSGAPTEAQHLGSAETSAGVTTGTVSSSATSARPGDGADDGLVDEEDGDDGDDDGEGDCDPDDAMARSTPRRRSSRKN